MVLITRNQWIVFGLLLLGNFIVSNVTYGIYGENLLPRFIMGIVSVGITVIIGYYFFIHLPEMKEKKIK